MGSFLASLYGGQNKTLNSSINRMGDLAGYSSNVGETGTNAAMDYNKGILSGDPTQIAMTLSPEIKTLGEQAQQNKNTVSQFGNRGGGMNAVIAGLDDATRAKLIQLMGGLRQGAAQNLQTMGQNNLQLGQQGTVDEAKLAQQRMDNWKNSLIGHGMYGAEDVALGAMAG
jgi:hypothetical protein